MDTSNKDVFVKAYSNLEKYLRIIVPQIKNKKYFKCINPIESKIILFLFSIIAVYFDIMIYVTNPIKIKKTSRILSFLLYIEFYIEIYKVRKNRIM